MKTTISFLTQEETKRRFAAIPTKRDRALFLVLLSYSRYLSTVKILAVLYAHP